MQTLRIGRFQLGKALAALGCAGSIFAAQPASAQATCDWYAKTALEQQKVNIDRKCGFTGEPWSSDRTSHMNWCREVAPDQWKRQAQTREQQLTKCAAGRNN